MTFHAAVNAALLTFAPFFVFLHATSLCVAGRGGRAGGAAGDGRAEGWSRAGVPSPGRGVAVGAPLSALTDLGGRGGRRLPLNVVLGDGPVSYRLGHLRSPHSHWATEQ